MRTHGLKKAPLMYEGPQRGLVCTISTSVRLARCMKSLKASVVGLPTIASLVHWPSRLCYRRCGCIVQSALDDRLCRRLSKRLNNLSGTFLQPSRPPWSGQTRRLTTTACLSQHQQPSQRDLDKRIFALLLPAVVAVFLDPLMALTDTGKPRTVQLHTFPRLLLRCISDQAAAVCNTLCELTYCALQLSLGAWERYRWEQSDCQT